MRIALDSLPSRIQQILRTSHLIRYVFLHMSDCFVGIVQLKQKFLLRHLHLQIHSLLYARGGTMVGEDKLHCHTYYKEERC